MLSNRGDQLLNLFWSHRTMMFPLCCWCGNNLQVGECENWLNYQNSITHLFWLLYLYLRKSRGNILISDIALIWELPARVACKIHPFIQWQSFLVVVLPNLDHLIFWLVKLGKILSFHLNVFTSGFWITDVLFPRVTKLHWKVLKLIKRLKRLIHWRLNLIDDITCVLFFSSSFRYNYHDLFSIYAEWQVSYPLS